MPGADLSTEIVLAPGSYKESPIIWVDSRTGVVHFSARDSKVGKDEPSACEVIQVLLYELYIETSGRIPRDPAFRIEVPAHEGCLLLQSPWNGRIPPGGLESPHASLSLTVDPAAGSESRKDSPNDPEPLISRLGDPQRSVSRAEGSVAGGSIQVCLKGSGRGSPDLLGDVHRANVARRCDRNRKRRPLGGRLTSLSAGQCACQWRPVSSTRSSTSDCSFEQARQT